MAQLKGGTYVGGDFIVATDSYANTFKSTIPTGIAPIVVTSTTKVINLNADLLDGYHADVGSTVSSIALRNDAGDISAREFILTQTIVNNIAPSSILGIYPTTNQITRYSATGIRLFLGLGDMAYETKANYFTGTKALTAGNADTADSAKSVLGTVAGTGSIELVRGNMADNDQFRILIGGTASNAGYAELATADDGNEPIYVRQYTGVFGSLVRSASLLDESGNTSFPNTLRAGTFVKNGGTTTQFLKADGTVDSNTYSLDNNVVHINGTETITGTKTFSNVVSAPKFIGFVEGKDNTPANALLQSGVSRGDNESGSTWIYLDSAGGTSSPWGIKHNQPSNLIEYYGSGSVKTYIDMSNGNINTSGNISSPSLGLNGAVQSGYILDAHGNIIVRGDVKISDGTASATMKYNSMSKTLDFIFV